MGDFSVYKPTSTIPMAELRKALLGGDSVADAMKEGRCIQPEMGCGKLLRDTVELDRCMVGTFFRDPPSKAEYRITGLCQACQDKIEAFAEEAEGAYDEPYEPDFQGTMPDGTQVIADLKFATDYGFIQNQGDDYLDQD